MSAKGQNSTASAIAASFFSNCSPELTIYHQDQELQMKKAELRSNQHGGSSHKEKSGWGSKLGGRMFSFFVSRTRRLEADHLAQAASSWELNMTPTRALCLRRRRWRGSALYDRWKAGHSKEMFSGLSYMRCP
jgi:hypothetical protein